VGVPKETAKETRIATIDLDRGRNPITFTANIWHFLRFVRGDGNREGKRVLRSRQESRGSAK